MNKSKTVYLGSIPYDQTEQQILDLCENIGPVKKLKMMFDPMTGKSKGYAFIEFQDYQSSLSAIRNLNGLSFGNRTLKCGYSSQQQQELNEEENDGMNISNDTEDNNNKYDNLPGGIDVNINMTTPAMTISSIISKHSKEEQLDLLRTIKEWIAKTEDKEYCYALIREYPQLSFVIAELLLSNGLSNVDELMNLAPANENDNTMSNNKDTGNMKGEELSPEKMELIKQVMQMSDSDISVLPEDEKMALWELKQAINAGQIKIYE